jgi:hypothetical protein
VSVHLEDWQRKHNELVQELKAGFIDEDTFARRLKDEASITIETIPEEERLSAHIREHRQDGDLRIYELTVGGLAVRISRKANTGETIVTTDNASAYLTGQMVEALLAAMAHETIEGR